MGQIIIIIKHDPPPPIPVHVQPRTSTCPYILKACDGCTFLKATFPTHTHRSTPTRVSLLCREKKKKITSLLLCWLYTLAWQAMKRTHSIMHCAYISLPDIMCCDIHCTSERLRWGQHEATVHRQDTTRCSITTRMSEHCHSFPHQALKSHCCMICGTVCFFSGCVWFVVCECIFNDINDRMSVFKKNRANLTEIYSVAHNKMINDSSWPCIGANL